MSRVEAPSSPSGAAPAPLGTNSRVEVSSGDGVVGHGWPEAAGYHEGPARVALREIERPGVSLALWQRELPAMVRDAVTRWGPRAPSYERTLNAFLPELTCVSEALEGLGDPHAWSWLYEDVRSLARELAERAGTPVVRFSLGPVRTDQCRKFHVDHVRMRLVCTYAGPATEWIANPEVERSVLEHPPSCPCDANQQILRQGGAVRHARLGDVLVMKGARYGGAELGAVHRSPPIEHLSVTRVVLIVSAMAEPQPRGGRAGAR